MASLYDNLNSAGGLVLQFEALIMVALAVMSLAWAVRRAMKRDDPRRVVQSAMMGGMAGLMAWMLLWVARDGQGISRLLRASAAGSTVVAPFFM